MLKFLMFFFAVLVGLGFVRLINALAAYLQNREKVRIYWVHASWVAFMILLYINIWWGLWAYRDVESWTYFSYLLLLTGPLSLFLATSLLVPEIEQITSDGEEPIATDEFFFKVHRGYFGAMSLVAAWGLALSPVVLGVADPAWPVIGLTLLVFLVLAWTANRRAHQLGAVAIWILFLALVVTSGLSLSAG